VHWGGIKHEGPASDKLDALQPHRGGRAHTHHLCSLCSGLVAWRLHGAGACRMGLVLSAGHLSSPLRACALEVCTGVRPGYRSRHQAGGADLHSSKPLLTARPRRRAPAQLVARPGRRPPALPQARDDRGPHRRGRFSHRERGADRAGAGAPLLCAHHGSQLGFLQYCQAACCRCAALPPGASRELAAERPCVFT